MSYPPEILASFFPALPSPRSQDDQVWLVVEGKESARNPSFPNNTNFCFAPGVEEVRIKSSHKNPQNIASVTLELFCRKTKEPIASRVVNPSGSNFAIDLLLSEIILNRSLKLNEKLAFPDGQFTVDCSPYQLRMTTVENGNELPIIAWTFFHIIVADIQLFLGDQALIPEFQGLKKHGFNFRNKTVHSLLFGQFNEGKLSGVSAPPRIELDLPNNVFPKDMNETEDDSAIQAHRETWGDGPLIPIVATVHIRNSKGVPVDAPEALGNVKFLWDWEGGSGELNLITSPKANTFVDTKAITYKPGAWPIAKNNCHHDFGGKRGERPPFYISDRSSSSSGATRTAAATIRLVSTAADASSFPFPTEHCRHRRWALFSYARTSGNLAGHTGIIFQPAPIAGDAYKLTVYLAYDELDVDKTGNEWGDLTQHMPEASTPEFVIQRAVHFARHWKKSGAIDSGTIEWDKMQAHFTPSKIKLDLANGSTVTPRNISAKDYNDAFTTAKKKLSLIRQLALADGDQWQGLGTPSEPSKCAMTFKSYRSFKESVSNYLSNNWRTQVQKVQPMALGLEERERLLFSPKDFEIPLNNDQDMENLITSDVNRVRDLLLGKIHPDEKNKNNQYIDTLGIINKTQYKKLCKAWGDGFLQELCSQLMWEIGRDIAGLHLFQFEFQDNFNHYPEIAAAQPSASNFANCPECDQKLTPDARENRSCRKCGASIRNSSVITATVPLKYYSSGITVEALKKLDLTGIGLVYFGRRIGSRPDIVIAHEIGHQLFLSHSPHGIEIPQTSPGISRWQTVIVFINNAFGGQLEGWLPKTKPEDAIDIFHDKDDEHCMMGYNGFDPPRLHFCGVCVLRLRGWRARVELPNNELRFA